MMACGLHLGGRALMCSSSGVVLLPLSGVNGLVYTPGLALWLLLAGIHARRSGAITSLIALCIAGLSLLLIPIYFDGLQSSTRYSGDMVYLIERSLANLPALALTAASFVAQGLGSGAVALSPFTAMIVSALMGICLGGVLKLVPDHFGITSLLFLIGVAGLVSAVSISLIGNTSFYSRYALQAAPILCWMFLLSVRCKGLFVFKCVQLILMLLSVVALYGNSSKGLAQARMKDQQFSAFVGDIRKGTPPSQLIARHQRAIFPYPETGGASFHDSLDYWFDVLKKARHATFANLGKDPDFQEVPLKERPQFVYGIRVTGYALQSAPRQIAVSWSSSSAKRCYYWNPPPNPQDRKFEKFTCWIYEEIKDLKIETAPPLDTFSSMKVFLLIPIVSFPVK